MFGEKPKTYQDIVRMNICQQLMARFPQIDIETMKKIYDVMVKYPNAEISIGNSTVHFAEEVGEPDIYFPDPLQELTTLTPYHFLIQNNMLYSIVEPALTKSLNVYGSSSSAFDGGTAGNNNNNNNNNA
ncbi:MAG: hypothetical protein IKU34_06145 [Clostridia bacterium]|nr:hypothetical protein [Clostridia bacterium]